MKESISREKSRAMLEIDNRSDDTEVAYDLLHLQSQISLLEEKSKELSYGDRIEKM
jgi:hypothetical protein